MKAGQGGSRLRLRVTINYTTKQESTTAFLNVILVDVPLGFVTRLERTSPPPTQCGLISKLGVILNTTGYRHFFSFNRSYLFHVEGPLISRPVFDSTRTHDIRCTLHGTYGPPTPICQPVCRLYAFTRRTTPAFRR
jgi:hypothetical protein